MQHHPHGRPSRPIFAGPSPCLPRGRRRTTALPAALVGLSLALTGCSTGSRTSNGQSPGPSPSTPAPTTTTTAPVVPTATTRTGRIREVLRSRQPVEAKTVIALAGAPMSWATGRDRVLLEYWLTSPRDPDWPDARVIARRVVDRQGRILSESVQRTQGWWDTWAVGHDFITADFRYGLSFRPSSVFLLGQRAPTPLTFERSYRSARHGDIRFGYGWLYDPRSGTVSPELLPPCRKDTARVDGRGRIWCLDRSKTHVLWSDDGRRWAGHVLSTTYFDWCDGGTLGADLAISGDTVAIGLWRADFTTDRGITWHDVSLPYRRVGAHRGTYPNCTRVEPLPDGRLVLTYFRTLVGDDPANTGFSALRTPAHTFDAGASTYPADARDGALLAVSREPSGPRHVSYDGGHTWHPVRVSALLHHLLPTG
jgi:hypothetical protein